MKIWELHSQATNGAIRTTADGDADIDGLILSEKAYLLVMRDFRPAVLVRLVQENGPYAAADALVAHFATYSPDNIGRALARGRSRMGDPIICRSDEAITASAPPGRAAVSQ
jgi:hypothetical protein